MKSNIKDIREITDSKEMYDSKPHHFLAIFIYVVLMGLGLGGIWIYFGEIDIVAKGVGVVKSNTNVSSVRNKVQGEVFECHLEEGKVVKKGDMLFSIVHDDLEIERIQAAEELHQAEERLIQLEKLRESVEQECNLFSIEDEKEYYDRYVKYEIEYQSMKNSVIIESKNESITTTLTTIDRTLYEDKIEEDTLTSEQLMEYRQSVEEKRNVFKNKNCLYALEFDNYLIQMEELEHKIVDHRKIYEVNKVLYEEGLVAKKEFEDAQESLELAENEVAKMKNTILKTIEEKSKEVSMARQSGELERSKLIVDHELLDVSEEQRQLEVEKYKAGALVELHNQIEELEIKNQSRRRELEGLELAIADCMVVAPIDGTIHMIKQVNRGDFLDVGVDIATIIPMNDSMYKIEIFIPNREIAGLSVNDKIKYKFDALPYKEYGHLEGLITNISTDVKTNDSQEGSGYIIEGSIINQPVYNYKDEPAEIKIGMTCEAHVVIERKKIVYYLLEKINLID